MSKNKEPALEKLLVEKLLGLAGQHAQTVLVTMKFEQLVPTWVLLDRRGHIQVVGTPWRNDAHKQSQVENLRRQMRKAGVIAYSFLCEAWAVKLEPGECDLSQPLPEADRPRNRVDRIEVVSALAATSAVAKYAQWEICRGPLGDVSELVPLALKDASDFESWLAKLLA